MTTHIECRRCQELLSDAWRLSQRLADAERRITALQDVVERVPAQIATLRCAS